MIDSPNAETDPDPFEDLLNLESQYHSEGYALGVTDGSRTGRIEGRLFGLEKGFDKFLEMGRLQGRTAVWRARTTTSADAAAKSGSTGQIRQVKNERLNKHLSRLHELTDLETLSTENSEDAVGEFDERVKDARAKARLVERILGEEGSLFSVAGSTAESKQGMRVKDGREKKTTTSKEMEDFTGIPRGKAAREGV